MEIKPLAIDAQKKGNWYINKVVVLQAWWPCHEKLTSRLSSNVNRMSQLLRIKVERRLK